MWYYVKKANTCKCLCFYHYSFFIHLFTFWRDGLAGDGLHLGIIYMTTFGRLSDNMNAR